MAIPKFSADEERELRLVGASSAQISRLQSALPFIQKVIARKAGRRETLKVLENVETQAQELSRSLSELLSSPAPEHQFAHGLIESRYWTQPERQLDSGPTSAHHMLERLTALVAAAQAARDDVPRTQTRQTAANPQGVRLVESALFAGWMDDHRLASSGAMLPLPDKWRASRTGDEFRRVVSACYRTIGGNEDPLRAINAYLSSRKAQQDRLLAALDEALNQA
ncbi:hypothetical protein [Thermomonas sp.]|uniref:hypothetical protein n=1 Tax=Thermomonas sp. TaxID=1971895 RepID=UPI0035B31744